MTTPETDHGTFLIDEAQRIRRETRMTWIVGMVLAFGLIGYFSFIYQMVGTFLDPENAAFLVADTVREMVQTANDAVPRFATHTTAQLDRMLEVDLPLLAPSLQALGKAQASQWQADSTRLASDNPEITQLFLTQANGSTLFAQTAFGLASLDARVEELLAKDSGDLTPEEAATLRAIIGLLRQLAHVGEEPAPASAGEGDNIVGG